MDNIEIRFDEDRLEGQQWLVIEHYPYGFSTIGKFATRGDAVRFLRRRETALN